MSCLLTHFQTYVWKEKIKKYVNSVQKDTSLFKKSILENYHYVHYALLGRDFNP